MQHPVEDAYDITENLPSFSTGLNVNVASITRLSAALAVWNYYVAVLSNLVQRPLIHQRWCNTGTQAVPIIGHEVIEDPGRVIRPSPFERTIPHTRVGTGGWVIVLWNLDQSAFSSNRYLRDR
ncbi:hypothetical protein D3C80_1601170 [compost metagenome]